MKIVVASAIIPLILAIASLQAYGATQIPKGGSEAIYEPFLLDLAGGGRLDAKLGRIEVLENRSNPDGRKISIAFVLLKSTAVNPGPPTIYLEGGPGIPAIQMMQRVPSWRDFLLALRATGDVVVFDQRGIGLSTPNLALPDKFSWSGNQDVFLDDSLYAISIADAKRNARKLRENGFDLSAYNTVESADDVDAIRKALGVPNINLVGFSYGTHLALATLRRHESHVKGVVLMGPAGPDHLRHLPGEIQGQLERIATLAKQDPAIREKIPDLLVLMREVLEGAEKNPIVVEVEFQGKKMPLRIGRLALEVLVFADLSDTKDIPLIPMLFYTISKGDCRMLAALFSRRFLKGGQGSAISSVMRIASGASRERQELIKKELPGCLIGGALDFPFQSKEYREAWGVDDLGPEFRSPVRSSVPLLVFTGTLDGSAPTDRGREICANFPGSHQMIVENAGHEDFHHPEVSGVIQDFLGAGKKPANPIRFPTPVFKALP